jgi:hypothetical protein
MNGPLSLWERFYPRVSDGYALTGDRPMKYPSPALARGLSQRERRKPVGPLSLWERVRVRDSYALTRCRPLDYPSPLPEGEV